jgi:hypothetical protein
MGAAKVVVGLGSALFGASCGYGFARYQDALDLRARRRVLATSLAHELTFIDQRPPPYHAVQVFYRDPVRLATLDHLLDGRTLDSRKHADAVRALLVLSAAIARYNDLVKITNLAQSTAALPNSTHRQMFQALVERHRQLVGARQEVETHLARIG